MESEFECAILTDVGTKPVGLTRLGEVTVPCLCHCDKTIMAPIGECMLGGWSAA